MALVAAGHGRGAGTLAAGSVHARANRVMVDRGDVREWYAAGPLGIEQGFTVGHRPLGRRGHLTLALQLRGSIRTVGSRSQLRFVTRSGRAWLRYGGLVALDNSGRRLPAGFESRGSRLILSVDDRRARYPVRIDPLIQQAKLTPNDEDTNGLFGSSVALSSDGNTALIGGPLDGVQDVGALGAAWVFTRSASGAWTQQGSKLTPKDESGNAQFGSSVALSSDGNTALIGGSREVPAGGSGAIGAAWVFTRAGGVWTQQGSKLTPNDASGNSQFGASVALSSNGTIALIGGPFDHNTVGAAWVFTESAGAWTQHGSKLTGSDEVSGAQFGSSVALSSDASTALIGGPFDDTGPGSNGAAWAFTGSGGTLAQQGSKLTPSDNAGFAKFGAGVALSSAGDTALIGGPADNGSLGAAWTFTRSAGTWTQRGSKLTGGGEVGLGEFGFTVALSSPGTTALIGGHFDNGVGATWQFAGPPGAMTQQGSKLTPSGQIGAAGSGFAVALSADGDTALTGGPFDNGRLGAAWVFTPPAPNCVNVAVTTAAGGDALAVQLSCIGAPGARLNDTIVAPPAHGRLGAIAQGSGQVTYTPQSGFNGQDSFSYQTTDQWGGTSNLATVTVTIPPAVPVCTDTTASTPAGGGQVTATLLCTAPPGVPLTYKLLTSPAHGVVSAVNQINGQVNYLSQNGFTGQDSFSYQASDPGGASNTATTTITVPPPPPRPVASILGPTRALVGRQNTYQASVIDSLGTPNAYRWTLAGKQIGTSPTLKFGFVRPGRQRVSLRVGDTAANTMTATLDVNVTSPRLAISVAWNANFSIPPASSVFTSLIAQAVPIGTRIKLSCTGRGCPFAHRAIQVTASVRCHRQRCQTKHRHTNPRSRSVDLTPLLHRARLHIGAHLAIAFQKRLFIGRLDTFTFRAKGPHLRKACLPPGKNTPAKRC